MSDKEINNEMQKIYNELFMLNDKAKNIYLDNLLKNTDNEIKDYMGKNISSLEKKII